MKKSKIIYALLSLMLFSCSHNVDPVQSKEDEQNQELNSNDQLTFRTLKVDGFFEPDYTDDPNYNYKSIFYSPLLITSEQGMNQLASEYADFYQERYQYMSDVNFETNNILLISFSRSLGYYDFQPLQLTIENDTLVIYYHMVGEGDGYRHDKLSVYTHAIIEVPILDDKIKKITAHSDISDLSIENPIIRM